MTSKRISILFILVLLFAMIHRPAERRDVSDGTQIDRVVISSPLLVVLHFGDRFLAANFESIRASATGVNAFGADIRYLLRAQQVAAELNPCHEDNYYLANAFLTWGGAAEYTSSILQMASDCRYWDDIPAFFLGFNQYFFFRNIPLAQEAMNIAAARSTANSAGFKKFSVMIGLDEFQDDELALQYLIHERERASDARLQNMLEKRIIRLKGLIKLRKAKNLYEQHYSTPLTRLDELISSGFINEYPIDPLKLGYEIINGEIHLRQIKIFGMENRE